MSIVEASAGADQNKERGLLGLPLETCFGWRIQATVGKVKANSFLNFPMQSHGAEMLRIASCLAIQHGLNYVRQFMMHF